MHPWAVFDNQAIILQAKVFGSQHLTPIPSGRAFPHGLLRGFHMVGGAVSDGMEGTVLKYPTTLPDPGERRLAITAHHPHWPEESG